MTAKEVDFTIATLKAELMRDGGTTVVRDSIAIYRHSDGRLSASPFAGTAPVAADGSDEIIWEWEAGDYDSGGFYSSHELTPEEIVNSICDSLWDEMTERMRGT